MTKDFTASHYSSSSLAPRDPSRYRVLKEAHGEMTVPVLSKRQELVTMTLKLALKDGKKPDGEASFIIDLVFKACTENISFSPTQIQLILSYIHHELKYMEVR